MATTRYEKDVLAWSREQAELLPFGRWSELDIDHIVDEIDDVDRSEQRELANRMAVLSAHLLKWQFQPDRQSDALYDEAVHYVTSSRRVSISSVQRKLRIGYNRAARLIEAMEAAGVVSEMASNGQREVLAPPPAGD